jgi:hypothetical protein
VLDAQHDVEQNQALVTSLSNKLSNFQMYMSVADSKRTQALNNKNLVDQLVQNALNLKQSSGLAFFETNRADSKTKELSAKLSEVMNKLIYSAELINKLAASVVRKKASNPLISDELISVLGTAGTDANNAVAVTLVALQSTFAAQATNIESKQAMALEFIQAREMYEFITGAAPGQVINTPAIVTGKTMQKSLYAQLYLAYEYAKQHYDSVQNALKITTRQLNQAQMVLNRAQVKLTSLQAGYSAANAAAMAS